MAWVTFAQGDRTRGLELLRSAAAAEDATDKSAVSPGPLAPARELLAYMLLEANRPADALVEFEATIKKEPNRLRGVYGGARAAEAAGQRARATALYKQLMSIADGADPGREELIHARAFLGSQQ
jgi:Tfp pilus assembly protein PilF